MRYLSLFSGIGGFELGIEQAHESNLFIRNGETKTSKRKTSKQGMESAATGDEHSRNIADNIGRRNAGQVLDTRRPECVGYSEVDKYPIGIYKKHFPNHKNYGDITKIKADKLPDFDFLVGGFPCQSFSIAGRRGGFADTRGTLFFHIARILQGKKPQRFLLENVKGLLSHDDGQTFKKIIATLDELGYDLQWQVLNSKDFGVPQNRERVYIVGHLRGTARPEVFPFVSNDEVSDQETQSKERRSQAEVSHTLRGPNVKADQVFIAHNVYGGFGEKEVRRFYDHSPTLRTPKGGGHIPTVVDLKATPNSTRRGQFSKKGFAKTLDHNCNQGVIKDALVRRLTPRECERLQGFPDYWTTWGVTDEERVKVSDSQRYKCCGNAVTVNVVAAIMTRLLRDVS